MTRLFGRNRVFSKHRIEINEIKTNFNVQCLILMYVFNQQSASTYQGIAGSNLNRLGRFSPEDSWGQDKLVWRRIAYHPVEVKEHVIANLKCRKIVTWIEENSMSEYEHWLEYVITWTWERWQNTWGWGVHWTYHTSTLCALFLSPVYLLAVRHEIFVMKTASLHRVVISRAHWAVVTGHVDWCTTRHVALDISHGDDTSFTRIVRATVLRHVWFLVQHITALMWTTCRVEKKTFVQ